MALVGHWMLDDTAANSNVTFEVGAVGTLQNNTCNNVHVGAGNGPGGSIEDCGFDFTTSNNERILLYKLNLTGAYSIGYWVKSSDVSQSFFHFDNRDAAGDGFIAFRAGSSTSLQFLHENDGSIAAGPELHDGDWHHVLCVYDGSTGLEAFVDGTSIGTDTTSAGGVAVDTAAAVIGARSYTGTLNSMSGIIADVRAYNSDESANVANIIDFARPTLDITISGTAEVGQTLSSVAITNDSTATIARQWKRDGVDIAGATSSTYVVQAADAGTDITLYGTATNTGGAGLVGTDTSNAIAIPAGSELDFGTLDAATATASAVDATITGSGGTFGADPAVATASAVDVAISGSPASWSLDPASATATAVDVAFGSDMPPFVIDPAAAAATAVDVTISGSPATWSLDPAIATASAVDVTIAAGLAWDLDAAVATASAVDVELLVETPQPVIHLADVADTGTHWANAAEVDFLDGAGHWKAEGKTSWAYGEVPAGWTGYNYDRDAEDEILTEVDNGLVRLTARAHANDSVYCGLLKNLGSPGTYKVKIRYRLTELTTLAGLRFYTGPAYAWVDAPEPSIGEWIDHEVTLEMSQTSFVVSVFGGAVGRTCVAEIAHIELVKLGMIANPDVVGEGTLPAGWSSYFYPTGADAGGSTAASGSILTITDENTTGNGEYFGVRQSSVLTTGRYYIVRARWRVTSLTNGTATDPRFRVFNNDAGNNPILVSLDSVTLNEWQTTEGFLLCTGPHLYVTISSGALGRQATVEIDWLTVEPFDGATLSGIDLAARKSVGPNSLDAVEFDGDLDYGDIVYTPDTTEGFTFAAWVRNDAGVGSSQARLLASNTTSGWSLELGGNSDLTLALGGYTGGTNRLTASDVLTIGNYHHVAATYSGGSTGTITLLVDGEVVAQQSQSGPIGAWADNLRIGSRNLGADSLGGAISDVFVFDQPLSPAYIRDVIYPRGVGPLDWGTLDPAVATAAAVDATISGSPATWELESAAAAASAVDVTITGSPATWSLDPAAATASAVDVSIQGGLVWDLDPAVATASAVDVAISGAMATWALEAANAAAAATDAVISGSPATWSVQPASSTAAAIDVVIFQGIAFTLDSAVAVASAVDVEISGTGDKLAPEDRRFAVHSASRMISVAAPSRILSVPARSRIISVRS